MKNSGKILYVGLLLMLITLKLAGVEAVASWSWWWVLAPLWMPVPVYLTVLLCGAILTKRRGRYAAYKPKKRRV